MKSKEKENKEEKLFKLARSLGIFYGYQLKKLYKEVYKEDISHTFVYKCIKKWLEDGSIEYIGEITTFGNFSWGDLSTKRLYVVKDPEILVSIKFKEELEKFLFSNIVNYLSNLIRYISGKKKLDSSEIMKIYNTLAVIKRFCSKTWLSYEKKHIIRSLISEIEHRLTSISNGE